MLVGPATAIGKAVWQYRHNDERTCWLSGGLAIIGNSTSFFCVAPRFFGQMWLVALFNFEHLHWLTWHNGRNSMLVDKLGMSITAQKHAEIVERRDNSGQFHTVNEENCQRNLLFPD
jgi:hypothetical protein